MGDIHIKYAHLEKTDAIHDYVLSKFSKLDKFLHDDYRASINIIDNTPKKPLSKIEYKVVMDLHNIEKSKSVNYTITQKCRDLYSGIDELVDTMHEKMRRNHEKNTNHFKNFKQKLLNNYMKLAKESK